VTGQLGTDGLAKIAGMLGTDEESASKAVYTSVGAMTAAMARNSSDPNGAAALDRALEEDHDGSIFDNLGDFLGNVGGGPGAGILGHVFGGQQEPVAKEISSQSGLDIGKVTTLLTTVAPLLMGALGKKKRDEGLDAGGLAGMLDGERSKVEQSGGLGGLLGMLGGLTGGGSQSSGGGGLLSKITGMLGGLLKRRG
jgi:hypothetical protein